MLKVLFAVIVLIAAVMIAGVHFRFNPAIPIFVILGFGLYMVARIGGPPHRALHRKLGIGHFKQRRELFGGKISMHHGVIDDDSEIRSADEAPREDGGFR